MSTVMSLNNHSMKPGQGSLQLSQTQPTLEKDHNKDLEQYTLVKRPGPFFWTMAPLLFIAYTGVTMLYLVILRILPINLGNYLAMSPCLLAFTMLAPGFNTIPVMYGLAMHNQYIFMKKSR